MSLDYQENDHTLSPSQAHLEVLAPSGLTDETLTHKSKIANPAPLYHDPERFEFWFEFRGFLCPSFGLSSGYTRTGTAEPPGAVRRDPRNPEPQTVTPHPEP